MKDANQTNWKVEKLGDVCALIKRGIAPKYLESGGVQVVNQKCIRNHEIDYSLARRNDPETKRVPEERLIQVGDVLINSTGTGTLGRVAQVREQPPEPTTVDTHVTIVRPTPGRFFPDFFGYMMIAIEDELISGGHGASGQTELPRTDLERKFTVSFPTSLEEQQRIVAVLDEVFEGLARARAHAEANLQNAQELFGSALQVALRDETVSWNDVELADLGDIVTGSTPKTSDKGNLGDHVPFVKPGDFLPDGSLVYDNQGLSKKGAAVSRVLPGGSALMVCIGATIGKAGYSDRPIATNQQVNAVAPKDGISGEYLYYQMLTPEFQADVMRGAGQATLPIINKGKWSKLKVRMPSDLSKQAGIVDKLSSIRARVDAASTQYEAQILDLHDLRQSLLQKAFAGELT